MIHLKKDLKILLVEANPLNQKLMMFNLSKMGFNVTIIENGKKAVEIYSSTFFDSILMDVMMPIMDGYEATKLIRQYEATTGNHSYIIGLTSNVYDYDREKCIETGMDNYIPKPFNIDFFCDILHEQHFL